MHYLCASLEGDAACLIANLKISADSFASAWDFLAARYENKRLLKTAHITKLRSLQKMEQRSSKEPNHILTTVSESISALKALGCSIDHWDDILVHDIIQLLDVYSREAWEIHLGYSIEHPTYEQLKTFLTSSARALESMESQLTPKKPPPVKTSYAAVRRSYAQASQHTPPTYVHLVQSETLQPSHLSTTAQTNSTRLDLNSHYSACSRSHYIAFCPAFSLLSYEDKMDLVKQERLCFNCLDRHNLRKCNISKVCKICDERHHTLLRQGTKTTPSATTALAATQVTSAPSHDNAPPTISSAQLQWRLSRTSRSPRRLLNRQCNGSTQTEFEFSTTVSRTSQTIQQSTSQSTQLQASQSINDSTSQTSKNWTSRPVSTV